MYLKVERSIVEGFRCLHEEPDDCGALLEA